MSESAHAAENRAVKTDRADMTAERAQSFVDSAKLTLYQPERQTLKFMAEDGYAVLNFDHKLVTAVPQKWRKKYDDYLEEYARENYHMQRRGEHVYIIKE